MVIRYGANNCLASHMQSCAVRFLTLLLALLCAAPVAAQDTSGPEAPPDWMYIRGRVGATAFPLGVMGEGIFVPQTALHRADSLVFKRTYVGGGGYVRVTPAFLEAGPRFSISPIDVFEFHAMGIATFHWPSTNGRVPFDTVANKTYNDRQVHPYESIGNVATLGVRLNPVLKLKFGPVIAVYGATINYHHMLVEDSVAQDQLLYDAGLDLLLHPQDWTFEQQAAVLAEVLDGVKTKARLRLGATVRQRLSIGTADETLNLGFIGTFKTGRAPTSPEFLALVLPYLRDTDRVLGPPWIFLGASWEFNPSLKPKAAEDQVAAILFGG